LADREEVFLLPFVTFVALLAICGLAIHLSGRFRAAEVRRE
jgi:hypothetical protein